MTQKELDANWFFQHTGMDAGRVDALVSDSLVGMDDGELFLEYVQSESLTFDDGRIKSASYNTSQGFGLRSVLGEVSGFAHSSDVSEDAIRRAAETVRAIATGESASHSLKLTPNAPIVPLYTSDNPLAEVEFPAKVAVLADIERSAAWPGGDLRADFLSGVSGEGDVVVEDGRAVVAA